MDISVVTSLYKSKKYVREFHQRCISSLETLGLSYEFIYVDDQCPEGSHKVAHEVLREFNSNGRVVCLAHNSGHQRAVYVGLQQAKGDYVFLLDSDLEEPPELVSELFNEIKSAPEALDVVYAVQRRRKGGLSEKFLGWIFFQLLNLVSDRKFHPRAMWARVMTRRYVDSVLQYKEKQLFLNGIFNHVGYNQKAMPADKGSHSPSSYTFFKKLLSSLVAITSFSSRPLLWVFVTGGVMCFVSISIGLIFLCYYLIYRINYLPGWLSLILAISFLGGLNLAGTGVLGLYLATIFDEIKGRPVVIREILEK